MLLDAAAAITLAALILTSSQGEERLTPQLPLDAVDRGDTWLAKGTPYTDTSWQTENNAFWIFIREDTAEIVGFEFDANPIPTAQHIARLRADATDAQMHGFSSPAASGSRAARSSSNAWRCISPFTAV